MACSLKVYKQLPYLQLWKLWIIKWSTYILKLNESILQWLPTLLVSYDFTAVTKKITYNFYVAELCSHKLSISWGPSE